MIEPIRGRPRPRYIALLVSVALLVLLVGALLRPGAKQASVVIPSNELVTLPERSQRRALRDMADYVGERAAAFGSSVLYLQHWGTSGLLVGRDSVLSAVPLLPPPGATAPASARFILERLAEADSNRTPARRVDLDTLGPRWALVRARTPDNRTLALAGLVGGVLTTSCGELRLKELVFDAAVPSAFAGGGLFDLDGNVMALAVPCAGRIALVPLSEVILALDRQRTVAAGLWARYGFRTAPADSFPGFAPPGTSGIVIAQTMIGAPADRAGLGPGDVIRGIGSKPVRRPEDLAPLLDATPGHGLVARRMGRGVTLAMVDRDTSAGIMLAFRAASSPVGLSLTGVAAGSRAAQAGLLEGDRIVQVGRDRQPGAERIRRAFGDTVPVFVVYQRGERLHGVLLK